MPVRILGAFKRTKRLEPRRIGRNIQKKKTLISVSSPPQKSLSPTSSSTSQSSSFSFFQPQLRLRKKEGGKEREREQHTRTHTLLSLLAGDLPNLNKKISHPNSTVLLFVSFFEQFSHYIKKPVPIIILRKRSHYACNLERMRKTIHGKRKEMFCRAFVNGC